MGNICKPVKQQSVTANQTQQIKTMIKINDTDKEVQFKFTTDKLIHISGDLLVLFVDRSANIRKNQHFVKLPTQAAKLQDYAIAQLNRLESTESKDCLTFSIMIPTLNFKKASLIFLDPWTDARKGRVYLQTRLQEYFGALQNPEIKKIVIGQFTSQLGIPFQDGLVLLLKSLAQLKQYPQSIHVCCLSEDSLKAFQSKLIDNKSEQLYLSSLSELSLTSDYY